MRRIALGIATVAAALGIGAPAFSYDDDTHYVLTYLLAREAGGTPEQARRVASACVEVDNSSDTRPDDPFPILSEQIVRSRFHAFRDSIRFSDPANADLDISQNALPALRDDVDRLGNPGVFLHAYQDSFSHVGFWSATGHLWDHDGRFFSHAPDYLASYPAAVNESMALGTIAAIQRSLSAPWGVPTVNRARVRQLVARITNANPDVEPRSRPNLGVARRVARTLLETYSNGDERLPNAYDYGFALLSDSSTYPPPSPFEIARNGRLEATRSTSRLPITTRGTFGLTMTPNTGNVTYEEVDYALAVYDPWANRGDGDGYRTVQSGRITPENPTFDIEKLPVGKVRLTLTAVRPDIRFYLKLDGDQTTVSTKDGQTRLVDNLRFTNFAFDSDSRMRTGKYAFKKIQVNCPLTKATLDGDFITDVKFPYSEGTLSLSFGPIPNPGRGARFSRIGWRGFDATDKVRFSYSPGKDSKTKAFSGIGKGRFTLDRGVASDATIAFSVSGTDSLKRPFSYSDSGIKLPRGRVGCSPNKIVFFYR